MTKRLFFALTALASFISASGAQASGFADFYRQEQLRLFSSLEGFVSHKAEDILINEFAAVKKAEVQLQTALGGRKGNIGINLLGAIVEGESNVIGWQLRAYGAQEDSKGVNTGIFYRHQTADSSFLGANAFLDYEAHKYGNFFRYSIGGEARHQFGFLSANYYLPITDQRAISGERNAYAFTREGYDIKMRMIIPGSPYLRAALDYYNFEGKSFTADEKGVRYGAEAHLLPGLRLALLYDNESRELGGDISYSHKIGESQQSNGGGDAFKPDVFAPVSREYSQRIALFTTAFDGAIQSSGASFVVGVQAPAATITIPKGGLVGDTPAGFAITANTILLFSASTDGRITQALTITNAAQTFTPSLTLSAQNAPPIVGNFDGYHSSVFLTGFFGTVGTVMASGGSGDLSYASSGAGFVVDNNNGEMRFRVNAEGTHTATVIIDDTNEHTPSASVMLTVMAVEQCAFINGGCPALGHNTDFRPPALSLATMLANAGANIHHAIALSGGSSGTEVGTQGIISQYVLFRSFGGANPPVVDIIPFLLSRGAEINYLASGDTSNTYNDSTALDNFNRVFGLGTGNNFSDIRDLLVANGGRCNARCRANDRDLANQLCTQATHNATQDCRPGE